MKLSELLQDYPCKYLTVPQDPEIEHLACHTEQIREGALWFCIPGSATDPTALIPHAIRRGAKAIILPEGISVSRDGALLIAVKDVREAASRLFYRFCGLETARLRFHAVTGTNGKTSTSFLLEHILRRAGNKTCLIGTVGCFINGELQTVSKGTTTPPPEILYPQIQAAREAGVTDVILEVSSHGIAQKRTAPILFETAIFTNLSSEHMDYHRTMEHYLETKAALFRQARRAIFCKDVPHAAAVCSAAEERLCYGEGCPHAVSDVETTERGTVFRLITPHETARVQLPVIGDFQAKNAALALLSAASVGIPISVGGAALRDFRGIPGRMEPITDSGDDITVLLDYAHTEEALRSALLAARAIAKGSVTVLFGCGGNRDTTKRAPMGRVAEELADYVYLTSDNPRRESPAAIVKDVLRGMARSNHRVILRRERAIRTAILSAKVGDLLVLAGKGHEAYEDGPRGKLPFSEREIARRALEERKRGILSEEDV